MRHELSTFIQAYTISSLLVCMSEEAVLQFCSIVSPLNTDFSISIWWLSVHPPAECPLIKSVSPFLCAFSASKNEHSSISSSVCWSLKHDFCSFLVIFWAPWLSFPFSNLRSVPIHCVTWLLGLPVFPPAMALATVKVSWRSIGNALFLLSTFSLFSFNWIISLLKCCSVSAFRLTDAWRFSCSASSLEILSSKITFSFLKSSKSVLVWCSSFRIWLNSLTLMCVL